MTPAISRSVVVAWMACDIRVLDEERGGADRLEGSCAVRHFKFPDRLD
jgi:hypothetical protein